MAVWVLAAGTTNAMDCAGPVKSLTEVGRAARVQVSTNTSEMPRSVLVALVSVQVGGVPAARPGESSGRKERTGPAGTRFASAGTTPLTPEHEPLPRYATMMLVGAAAIFGPMTLSRGPSAVEPVTMRSCFPAVVATVE